jgi:ribosome recycling factor
MVAWNEVKTDYLKGITPKELAKKYKTTARAISDKVYEENWKEEKTRISENIRENVQDRIQQLTNKSLNRLESVIDNPEAKDSDIVSACKAILDLSGLKSSNQNVNLNTEPVEVKFI